MLDFLRDEEPEKVVARLFEEERALDEDLQHKTAELDKAEGAIGAEVLASRLQKDRSSDRALKKLSTLRTEVEAIEKAIVAARAQRSESIRAVWAKEAVELRRRAADLRSQAAERGKKTADLLAKLKAHEGCDFAPAPQPQPKAQVMSLAAFPRPQMTKTGALEAEAVALTDRAAALESRKVPDGGQSFGTDLKALLESSCSAPMRLGPARQPVRDWFAKQQWAFDAWRRKRVDGEGPDVSAKYRLVWAHGKVNETASGWEPVEAEAQARTA